MFYYQIRLFKPYIIHAFQLCSHICLSKEYFEEFIGFDIWEIRTTMEYKDLFKCLRCARTDDDSDKMKEHIEAKHKLDKISKFNTKTKPGWD